MLRHNRLVLGTCLVSIALAGLIGTPASAGNKGGGNGGSSGSHSSNGHGHGFNPIYGFPSNRGQNFGRQVLVTRVTYGVLIKQPNRFRDLNWHEVNTFNSLYQAQQQAAILNSQLNGDSGFAVKVVQHNW